MQDNPDENTTKKSVCYRRNIDAKSNSLHEGAEADTDSSLLNPSLPQFLICLGTFAVALLVITVTYVSYQTNQIKSTYKVLAEEQKSGATIIVRGAEGHPDSIQAMELLRMYGFNPVLSPTLKQGQAFKSMPSESEIKKLMKVTIFLANGSQIDPPTLYKTIVKLPLVDFHPGTPKNSIILYGIQNCPYTDKAKLMLAQKGIAYEYVDLNSDAARYIGEMGARLIASGFNPDERGAQPFLEYNNHLYPRSVIYTIIPTMTK